MAERRSHAAVDFKFVFTAVIVLTLVFALATLLLVYFPPPKETGLLDTFTTLLKLGAGAIFGLVGGRAAA